MEQPNWYYQQNEQQCGPVTHQHILDLLAQQVLTADTYVWTEGMENWRQIGQIPEFAALISSGQARLRPTSVTVFGILNIVFGSLTLLCSPFGIIGLLIPQTDSPLQMGPEMRLYSLISYAVGFVMAFVLLASGIGLLFLKKWARQTALVYGWIALIWGIIGTIFTIMLFSRDFSGASQEEMPMLIGGIVGGMCGGLVGLIYPVFLIIFMRKSHVIEACSK